jgi:hypothetical protein
MSDRRYIYTYIPSMGKPFHRDRRERDRREHSGLTRILFIDLVEAWARLRNQP